MGNVLKSMKDAVTMVKEGKVCDAMIVVEAKGESRRKKERKSEVARFKRVQSPLASVTSALGDRDHAVDGC